MGLSTVSVGLLLCLISLSLHVQPGANQGLGLKLFDLNPDIFRNAVNIIYGIDKVVTFIVYLLFSLWANHFSGSLILYPFAAAAIDPGSRL